MKTGGRVRSRKLTCPQERVGCQGTIQPQVLTATLPDKRTYLVACELPNMEPNYKLETGHSTQCFSWEQCSQERIVQICECCKIRMWSCFKERGGKACWWCTPVLAVDHMCQKHSHLWWWSASASLNQAQLLVLLEKNLVKAHAAMTAMPQDSIRIQDETYCDSCNQHLKIGCQQTLCCELTMMQSTQRKSNIPCYQRKVGSMTPVLYKGQVAEQPHESIPASSKLVWDLYLISQQQPARSQ